RPTLLLEVSRSPCHRAASPTRRSSDLDVGTDGRCRYDPRGGRSATPSVLGRVSQLVPGSRRPASRPAALSSVAIEHRYASLLRLDRKSTRLNSSHVKISYAVFCLKTRP